MTVCADWHDEIHTIVRVEFYNVWTLSELSDAIRTSRCLITSVEHTVDVIWDASKARTIPSNLISHFTFPSQDAYVPANQGVVVVVVPNAYLKNFALLAKRTLFRLTRNMHIVESLSDAENMIASLRAETQQL